MLEQIEVKTFWQALVMRRIRNECREFMTRDKSRIGLFQQIGWFLGKYSRAKYVGKLYCFLYYSDRTPVGYGLMRKLNGKWWISGGLAAQYRGRGLGFELFAKLVDTWREDEIWLEVLKTNIAGQKIYRRLGFRKKSDDGRILIMKRSKRK